MLRFEKTDFGYRAYKPNNNKCFVYFGHFYTKKEAKKIYKEFKNAQVKEYY